MKLSVLEGLTDLGDEVEGDLLLMVINIEF